MKNITYITIVTLLTLSVGVGAATTLNTDGGVNSSVGGYGGFGTGNSNTDYTPLGGGNTDYTPLGGSNLDTTSLGQGGSAGPGVTGPAIEKPALTVSGFVVWIISLMNYIVWAMMTAALLVFLYGIVKLMFVGGANEESRSKGKKFMLWGIISLFVMVSVWGLVGVLKTSLFGEGDLVGPQFIAN